MFCLKTIKRNSVCVLVRGREFVKIHLILWAFLIYILTIMWSMEMDQLRMLHYKMQTFIIEASVYLFSVILLYM